jgi:hypothetical protein
VALVTANEDPARTLGSVVTWLSVRVPGRPVQGTSTGANLSGTNESGSGGYDVYCSVSVGKSEHHTCALDTSGRKIHDRPPPNGQHDVVAVLTGLRSHGRVPLIVDQPASIGALVIAVARLLGHRRGLSAGLGHAPHRRRDPDHASHLRGVGTDDETLAGLAVLAVYDDDLDAQSTRLTNRLRDALLHIHSALGRTTVQAYRPPWRGCPVSGCSHSGGPE